MVAARENFPLLAELLAEQQQLDTPVARFALAHESGDPFAEFRAQLIPLTAPRPGEQYAFEVELDSCTGCKACVAACHALNGLDETESWRDVGLVIGGDERDPFQQTVTSACHHCADPACLNGCPVLAYEKDPATGIVRHLDDQCIGCQYCILKCPYDVPKYNARLGIVRKCDLCQGRLGAGEAPACAQACPTQAIRIVTVAVGAAARPDLSVESEESRRKDPSAAFLRAAPDPAHTRPTTRYLSERRQPANLQAADAAVLRPQPPHWPLAIMLTLLPLAVGSHVLAALVGTAATRSASAPAIVIHYMTIAGWVAGVAGLAASVGHLGQPRRAWRVFLGWRRSWLSREALGFGGWFGVASVALWVPEAVPAAAVLGAAGLFCSAMIYIDTRRAAWRWTQTLPRFLGAAAGLGAAMGVALGVAPKAGALAVGAATVLKLGCDARLLRCLDFVDEDDLPDARVRTARLLRGPLRRAFGGRIVVALLTLMFVTMACAGGGGRVGGLLLAAAVCGELIERHLFFRAVDAPKMPGVPG
ncbi:MAG TPA: DmsC/YnfH family molybdoenzyme membrane anchor subunit [Opitutus sp.]|nr:DmsC/YnfH family molybdoenzyme membrane anchor subunit [Opitutus sp.]